MTPLRILTLCIATLLTACSYSNASQLRDVSVNNGAPDVVILQCADGVLVSQNLGTGRMNAIIAGQVFQEVGYLARGADMTFFSKGAAEASFVIKANPSLASGGKIPITWSLGETTGETTCKSYAKVTVPGLAFNCGGDGIELSGHASLTDSAFGPVTQDWVSDARAEVAVARSGSHPVALNLTGRLTSGMPTPGTAWTFSGDELVKSLVALKSTTGVQSATIELKDGKKQSVPCSAIAFPSGI